MDQAEIVRRYPRKYRQCRGGSRHTYSPKGIWTILAGGLRDRTEVCTNCGLTRTFTVNRANKRVTPKPKPNYPFGYLLKGSGLKPHHFQEAEYADDWEEALLDGRVHTENPDNVVTHIRKSGTHS
jgi:hypothetical protein